MIATKKCWAAKWKSVNKLDGKTEHLCSISPATDLAMIQMGFSPIRIALFRTRNECRRWIDQEYGYIRTRADLQAEPHGWRVPTPVRVTVTVATD